MPISFGPPPGVTLSPSAGDSAYDLVTPQFANNILLAGGVTLTPAQALVLPSLVTSASREIARFCSRKFTLQSYTEIVTPEGTRQDRGEPATAKLSAFPVQDVTQVMTGRQTVLTVTNTDAAANQIALVAFDTVGDVEYMDLDYVGLKLTRTASGVSTTDTLTFAAYPTVAALATAINALGDGWVATVAGRNGNVDPGKFPSASLVGVREPKDALCDGACLDLFLQGAKGYQIDRSAGILSVAYGSWGDGYGWGGFGFGDGWDGAGWGGGAWGWGEYRVVYQAGFTTVPADLQMVAAEVVKGMYSRLDSDPSLKSESADKYSWTAKESLANLSNDARATLMYYRSWSV